MSRWIAFATAASLSWAACKTQTPDRAGIGPCTKDDDCTLFCESKGDCCHDPYCEEPALASEARAITAYDQEHCGQSDYDKCPRIGARMTPSYRAVARCRTGACVVDRVPLDGGAQPPASAPAASSRPASSR